MDLNEISIGDLFGLYNSIRNGISYYAKDNEVESVAVDSWGASYGFLDEKEGFSSRFTTIVICVRNIP